MLLYPAIDLMSGQVVRLRQGRAAEKTIYSSDPAAFARQWEAEGGDWLHIVDLDASFSGTQQNLESVRAITSAVGIPCELGGGIRDVEAIRRALDAGVARVILGTKAAESLEFVGEMAREFGRDKIAVGIDAKNGIVSVKGWTQETGQSALELAVNAVKAGAGTIIYTDIATDGMLQGPNFPETERVNAAIVPLGGQLIASGGVGTAEHVTHLATIPVRLDGSPVPVDSLPTPVGGPLAPIDRPVASSHDPLAHSHTPPGPSGRALVPPPQCAVRGLRGTGAARQRATCRMLRSPLR